MYAQTLQPTRPERPYRGVFAGGVDSDGQSLTGNASLSGGYDDNILAKATNRNTLQTEQGGAFGDFTGGLNYALNGGRGSINAAAGTSQRYYPSLQDDYFRTYNASVGGMLHVVAKPDITLFQSASYQPYTFLSAIPSAGDPIVGASDPIASDYVPLATQYVVYDGGADLEQKLTRRTSFRSNWTYRMKDRAANHFWQQSAGLGFSVGMTRDLNLRLGYRYTEAHHDDRVTQIHRPDIGVDFMHALSLTRRTTLSFSVGTEATVYNDNTRYSAVGNVIVTHEMGRSWSTSGVYQRGTYFVDTLSEPVSGNSGSLQVTGLITRRVQLSGIAGASLGHMGFNTSRQFDSYRGSLGLSTALNRYMKVGVDYAYYRYDFDETVALDPGVPHEMNRQSIRAHVSLWAPIYTKARRSHASR